MRLRYALILVFAVGACSAPELPTINSPWEPTETQLAEPLPPTEAGVPAWQRIGNSIRGKPIEAVSLGRGARRVYVVGGLHGDEPEGPAAAAKLPAALLADLAGESASGITLRILRDANPDGTALNQRGNTRGTDLNRNFPTRDFNPEDLPGRRQGRRPASELEIDAVLKDLRAFKPDVVVVFRTAALGRGPHVAFEGPAVRLAYDFASAARTADPRWRASTDKSFVLPGSIDSLVARDMKKPVLSVELRRGSDAADNAGALRAAILGLAPAGRAPARSEPGAPPPREPALGGKS